MRFLSKRVYRDLLGLAADMKVWNSRAQVRGDGQDTARGHRDGRCRARCRLLHVAQAGAQQRLGKTCVRVVGETCQYSWLCGPCEVGRARFPYFGQDRAAGVAAKRGASGGGAECLGCRYARGHG